MTSHADGSRICSRPRGMGYIDCTWLAYAFDRVAPDDRIAQGLTRVGDHYQALYADRLMANHSAAAEFGMASWHRSEERLRWPLWFDRDDLAVASTNPPTGWERIVEQPDVAQAPLNVGAALMREPQLLGLLNPPFVISIHDRRAEKLVIVNDVLAAGRLYEMQTADGRIWSNRLGALCLFAGVAPEADAVGWAIHAASGWFLGGATPFRGATKVPAGTAIVIGRSGRGARVSHQATRALSELVAPRGWRARRSADQPAQAAEQSVALARSIHSIWSVAPTVNLSGGRDSRISAAGTIVAGVEAQYRTMDISPGEADVVKALIAAAPTQVAHQVTRPEHDAPSDGLEDRIGSLHLIHDGVANPMAALQSSPSLPQRQRPAPLISGHGGELGHGFYYSKRSTLRELRRGGRKALVKRLERSGRQHHSAALPDAYNAHLAEVERTLTEGEGYGLSGPTLLDYYYLAERLPFRAGLGARNDRYSACVTPAFIRGCFDLSPRERLAAKFHRAVMARLIPDWNRIPFFAAEGGRMRPMNRSRIWEKGDHAEELERMLDRSDLWEHAFDQGRVNAMWTEARAGRGHSHFESIFMRIAWRVQFEEHLETLAAAARGRSLLAGRS